MTWKPRNLVLWKGWRESPVFQATNIAVCLQKSLLAQCAWSVVPRINCMFTWAQPHALWAGRKTEYASTNNYLRDTFIILLVTQCVKKYFLHFSHFKMTLFPVCTVAATKRVDIYCIMEIRKVILFGVHLCVLAWCLYLTRSSLEPRSVLCQCLLELETKLRKDHKGLVRMDS